MTGSSDQYIGVFTYHGFGVARGMLSAQDSAQAIMGADAVTRYFLLALYPFLASRELEIPMGVQRNLAQVGVPGDWFALKKQSDEASAPSVAQEVMAGAPREGFVSAQMVREALTAAQWVMRIAMHMGTMKKGGVHDALDHASVADSSTLDNVVVGLSNSDEVVLDVPMKFVTLFLECPDKLFAKSVRLVNYGRSFVLGVDSVRVSVTHKYRGIFYAEESKGSVVLPELVHGAEVEFEGTVTRVNEKTNTLGLAYGGQTLLCAPKAQALAQFKEEIVSTSAQRIYSRVRVRGIVSRADAKGGLGARVPRIYFTQIVQVPVEDSVDSQQGLFDERGAQDATEAPE